MIMKKLLSILLVAILLVTAMPLDAFEFKASALTEGDYIYTISNGGVTITKVAATISGDIIIPSTLGGYPVTSIGDEALSSCRRLTSVTIPDSVTSIGYDAFHNCSSLTSVSLGNSVTSIGSHAFDNCESLRSITIPDSVTSIGSYAFYCCYGLTNVTITDLAAWCNIDFYCYYDIYMGEHSNSNPLQYAGNLYLNGELVTDLVIPNNVTEIKNAAFYNCKSLTSVTIPDSVTSIGDVAFYNCSSLENVTLSDSLTSIGMSVFSGTGYYKNTENWQDGVLYIGKYLIDTKTTIFGDCNIKDGTSIIAGNAFRNCSTLTSVTIPDSVTSIGDYAFYNCTSLTSFYINDIAAWCNIDFSYYIKDGYYHTSNPLRYAGNLYLNGELVTDLVIPNNVTEIKNAAFYNCKSLTSVTIPDSVTSIGDYAFYSCTSLANVYYRGSENDKKEISIYSDDSCLSYATWYYNSCIGSANHTYDNDCDITCNVCNYTRSITHIYTSVCDRDCNVCGEYRIADVHKVKVPDSEGVEYTFENSASYTFNLNNGIYSSTNKYDSSSSTATFSILKDGQLKIEYYTSTENSYDKLIIKQNNNTLATVSGETSWASITVDVTAGDKIYFTYSKDSSASNGNDTVYFKISSSVSMVPADEVEPTCVDAVVCDVCGAIVKTALGHKYSSICDNWCDVCDSIRVTEHTYDNSEDADCNICGFSHLAPKLAYKCSETVALVSTEGYEYSLDGENWQSSNVFTNLSENTTYNFYQRLIGTIEENYLPLTITLKAFQSTPNAPVVLGYSDTVIQLLPQSGMEYSLDGVTWQNSNIFRNLTPATEYTFYQRYAETDSAEASEASNYTLFKTAKVEQTLIPSAPTVLEVTAYSVTLNPVEGCEYSMDGTYWYRSNVFNNLSWSTEYTFYQRYAETDTTTAGESSKGVTVKTLKGTPSAPYYAPTLVSKTYDSVTLENYDWSDTEYEFSMDGINWQKSPVFTGLLPKMNYTFYQRIAETDEHYASPASPALTVKTDAKPPYTPGDIDGTGEVDLSDVTVMSRYLSGWDVDCNQAALDVNGDGRVNLNDLVHLAQYVAGWDVEIY